MIPDEFDREGLRARKRVALASAMHLSTAVWSHEGREGEFRKLTETFLMEQVILPYVAYGTVLVSDLAIFEKEIGEGPSGGFLDDLVYAGKKGLCVDLNEVFSVAELDAVNKRFSQSDPSVRQFNDAFDQADYHRSALLAEVMTREKYRGSDSKEWARIWQKEMRTISGMIGLNEYVEADPPNVRLRALSDEDLFSRHRMADVKTAIFELEAKRLQLATLGQRPTSTLFNYDLQRAEKPAEMKIVEIAVPKISLPRLERTKDLIDFVMMDEYRRPLRRLQSHCAELAANSRSIGQISQDIADDMNELDRVIKSEKLGRYLGICKFIFGTAFGFAEDIIKLRLESMAKRPFEVAEKITEQYYYGPQYEKDPLYFLWALNDRYGE
jgi:hypothetical protein